MVSYSKDPGQQTLCKKIGARVKWARESAGFTQERLADALHIRFQQVQKYETGYNRVPAAQLSRIAQVLGKQITFFYDDLQSVELPDKKTDRAIRKAAAGLFELPPNLSQPIANLILNLVAR
ncbi:MAG: helix-turn-helix transcriptional regulator [Patescibacteria group bacterium]